jgi:hypothetical protein
MILKTITTSFKDVSTFSILLFLFMYIYTLLGLELFAHKAKFTNDSVDIVNGSSPSINFDNFFNSIITVFIILTNDGWSDIFYNYYRSTGAGISVTYFITLIVLG